MNEEDKIITNEELQSQLSKLIRDLKDDKTDPSFAKTYFTGARTMFASVRIDMDGVKMAGQPLLKRTRRFIGLADSQS